MLFAMHISEGWLPAGWAGLWFLAVAPFWFWGLATIKRYRQNDPSSLTLVALVGAAVFVISCAPVPIPVAHTCSHPCGTGLAALLIGPTPTVVVSSVALLLQALLLNHGGLSTLGANVFSMGVVGPFSAWCLFALLRRARVPLLVALFLAGMLSDWAVYVTMALELSPTLPFAFTLAMVAPLQIPLGIAEGVVTAVAYRFVLARRPQLLALWPLAGDPAGDEA